MNASGFCSSPTSNKPRRSHHETTSGGRVSHATRCGLRSSAADADLSGNSCREIFFVNVSVSAVVTQLTPELHWGWDGACLESVSAFSHDPIFIGTNLYRYCGDDPTNYSDPTGLDPTQIAPGFPIPIFPILPFDPRGPTPRQKPAWCSSLEALIRSFLKTPQDIRAWDNFVGDKWGGTGSPINLTTDETESIIYGSKEFNDKIAALKKSCENGSSTGTGWKNTVETVSTHAGEPWAASIGGVSIKLTSSCQCGCLSFKAEIDDRYDFDPLYFKTHRTVLNELKTIGVSWAQACSLCMWKEFDHKGFTHGRVGSGCSAFD